MGLKPVSANIVVTGERTGKGLKLFGVVERLLRPFMILTAAVCLFAAFYLGYVSHPVQPVTAKLLAIAGVTCIVLRIFWRPVLRLLVWWRHE